MKNKNVFEWKRYIPSFTLRHALILKFTIIELLIVISIITLLTSLLLPAIINARNTAQRISCVNNMKQQSIGINLYVDSYNGYLPRTCGRWGWSYHIAEAIRPVLPWAGNTVTQPLDCNQYYIPKNPMFSCPAQQDNYGLNAIIPTLNANEQLIKATIYVPTNTNPTCSMINGRIGGWRNSLSATNDAATQTEQGKKLEKVLDNSVLLYETWYNSAWIEGGKFQALVVESQWGYSLYRNQLPDLTRYYYQPNYQRHHDASNFLYKDGHVASHRVNQNFDDHWRLRQ